MLLEAKFLDKNEQVFRVFVFDAQKTVSILHHAEDRGEWRNAKAGDRIQIQVTHRFAEENGLMGSTTYGTKSSGQSLGQGGPLMG
jgi:hypothetical protein